MLQMEWTYIYTRTCDDGELHVVRLAMDWNLQGTQEYGGLELCSAET